ncbi:MFS transporter [Lentilactobacillus fungorum]|uniref:MFS transporter n=1 Tax=Lentilactobacillus fungorum TaxID=2201250 RepID=A0ABQ3W0A0_9LACO|nr:MFS transporter [Lentilactobacillus fungorum]GHP13891.1 MFS transporter [Lentilactobacillus fungorum]
MEKTSPIAERENSTPKKPVSTFILLYAAYIICFIDRSSINIALSYIGTDFHLSTATLGVVASAFFFSYSFMQIPGGWLTDKFGTKQTVIFAITMWSLFTILTGFAWSLVSLLLIRFLFGIGEGAYPSASLKQISEETSYQRRSQATSGIVSSNYVGAAIAPMIMAPIIAGVGWRASFHVMGIIGLVFVFVYILILRPIKPVTASSNSSVKTKIPWSKVLSSSLIWKFFTIVFGLSIITKGLDTWMPTYLLQSRHINLAGIAWLVPLPSIAAGVGAIISGWLMVHFFAKKEKWFIAFASLLATIFMYGMYRSSSLASVISFEVLTYFFKSIAFSGSFAFFASLLTKRAYGSSIGIVNFGGQLAGFLAPIIIGILVESFGGSYSIAFLFLVFAAAIAFVASLTLGNQELQAKKQTAIKDYQTN